MEKKIMSLDQYGSYGDRLRRKLIDQMAGENTNLKTVLSNLLFSETHSNLLGNSATEAASTSKALFLKSIDHYSQTLTNFRIFLEIICFKAKIEFCCVFSTS